MRSFGSPIRRVFVNPTCIFLSSMLKDGCSPSPTTSAPPTTDDFARGDFGNRPLLAEPPHFRICRSAKHRGLDVTAGDPDIAQCAIVQLPQRLDRGPALPMGGHGVCPHSDPADQSAQQIGDRGLRGALGYRGHFLLQIGFRPAKRCRWRKRCSTAAAPWATSDRFRSPRCNHGLDGV